MTGGTNGTKTITTKPNRIGGTLNRIGGNSGERANGS